MMLHAIAGTLLVLACVLAQDRAVPAPLDVRYVANAGVLLTIDGRKILIDAPIRDGIPPYTTPSADERARLEAARPPYDGIAAILITHWHEDHLSPDAVAAHLRSSARTVLISSREVVDRVRQAGPDLPAARFRPVTPAPGSSTVAELEGLRVHVLRIRHNPARRLPAEHVGFLVQGTKTALHVAMRIPRPTISARSPGCRLSTWRWCPSGSSPTRARRRPRSRERSGRGTWSACTCLTAMRSRPRALSRNAA